MILYIASSFKVRNKESCKIFNKIWGKILKMHIFLAVYIFTHMLISIQMTTFENQLAGKFFLENQF